MSDITIWHNPRCSKSRTTLALLEERGLAPNIRRYLDNAPDEAEIRTALAALDCAPIDMMRTKEAAFREAGLSRASDADTLIRAMASNPRLIERPIVFANGTARLGRPPESVLEIL